MFLGMMRLIDLFAVQDERSSIQPVLQPTREVCLHHEALCMVYILQGVAVGHERVFEG